jgi:hypothetical protein
MAIEKDEQRLDEMTNLVISTMRDGLPFRIIIKSPDHLPPHAHVMDNETVERELGQFLIPVSKPRSPSDIKNYKQGISDDMRDTIFRWMKSRSKLDLKLMNWEFLYTIWRLNEPH